MNRWEMLEHLSAKGQWSEDYYSWTLPGWFGWSLAADADGSGVLTVRFEDAKTGETFEYEWVLNPKEGE